MTGQAISVPVATIKDAIRFALVRCVGCPKLSSYKCACLESEGRRRDRGCLDEQFKAAECARELMEMIKEAME